MQQRELVRLTQNGDGNAFSELIHQHKEYLYRMAYSYVKNREDALEVVDNTVYKAFLSIRKLKNPELFNTWLTRILINSAIDHLKKTRRNVQFTEENIPKQTETLANEERVDLYHAIDSLEEKQKTVIILKYLNDLTLREVAEILNLPLGSVKSILHKALKQLRLELKEEL